MNLFFRLVLVFLRAQFAKTKIAITDAARLRFSVWLTDQDMFAHMTNSRYMSFSDLGTINYIIRSGCWSALRKRGWFPVIIAQTMVVSRMLKTPQAFDIETRLSGWDDTFVGITHTFTRNGRVHATVEVLARFASRDKSKVRPQDVIDAVGETVISPPIPRIVQNLIAQVEAGKFGTSK